MQLEMFFFCNKICRKMIQDLCRPVLILQIAFSHYWKLWRRIFEHFNSILYSSKRSIYDSIIFQFVSLCLYFLTIFDIQTDLFPVLIENTWCFLKTNTCLFFHTSIKSIQYVIVKLYNILCVGLGLYLLQGDIQPSCFQRPCFFHSDGF